MSSRGIFETDAHVKTNTELYINFTYSYYCTLCTNCIKMAFELHKTFRVVKMI